MFRHLFEWLERQAFILSILGLSTCALLMLVQVMVIVLVSW